MEITDFKPGSKTVKTCAIIIAHPAEELLWAGGTILTHEIWDWTIVCLSGKNDSGKSDKFHEAMKSLSAKGVIGDIRQIKQAEKWVPVDIEQDILDLLPNQKYDLIITHNPQGEYTGQIKAQQISHAVISLWHSGKIVTKSLWTFAYEDNNGNYFPKPIKDANVYRPLTSQTWQQKQSIITDVYGYNTQSWETKTSPKAEAFYQFKNSFDASKRLAEQKNTLTF